jgi:uncharacterized protein (TIGR01244 family)
MQSPEEVALSLRNVAALLLVVVFSTIPAVGQDTVDQPNTDLGIDPEALPQEVNGFEGEIRGLWRDGRVFIGGQPDEAALARFQEIGVTAVINLRTPAEMDDRERVPFDEAAVIDSLEMEYVHIPLGGEEHSYSPEAVDRFADVLDRHKGPVLLHCTVAWRASYMWSAYLVREHGFSLDRAMARGDAMAIGDLPIEGLLGRPLKLAYTDDAQ